MTWAAILALAAGTYALKAVGPALLGGRRLPDGVTALLAPLPAALLAALVAVATFDGGERLVLDARVVGIAVAGVAVWRRLPFLAVVVLAAAAAAAARALGMA
ncbi:MAG: AzlD domain-containing protein [Thermoleophilia bacterium]